jgi:manganese transport protein
LSDESQPLPPHSADRAYLLDSLDIRAPPTTVLGTLRRLGPSLILTANVVGSGELIVTTTLGAEAGFVTLWVILVACLLKVALQLEFGRHAIATGETSLEAFNRLPGPRWIGASWSLWLWTAVKAIQTIQYGGVIGGVAIAMALAFPSTGAGMWAVLAGLAAALLTARGGYRFIEGAAIAMTALFSVFTVACVFFLQGTEYVVSWADLAQGMRFQLPAVAVGVALAAFGTTGVSSDEIMSYPYWCIEKGYARFAGPRDDSPEWVNRARGWMRVMLWDALLSMAIYTLSTAAFYVLGAAILHGRGQIPEGFAMLERISAIYTDSVGPGALVVFLAGAVATLFSTLFVALASMMRMFTDLAAQFGALDFHDPAARRRWFFALAWALPTLWTGLYFAFAAPLWMIVAGGVAVAALLLLTAFAAWDFRYRRGDPRLRPSRLYDVMLWLSFLAVGGVALRGLLSLVA